MIFFTKSVESAIFKTLDKKLGDLNLDICENGQTIVLVIMAAFYNLSYY